MKSLHTIYYSSKHASICVLVLLSILVSPFTVLAQESTDEVPESVTDTIQALPSDTLQVQNDTIPASESQQVATPAQPRSETQQNADRKIQSIKERMEALQAAALLDSTAVAGDSLALSQKKIKVFNPDGMRAVWLSALFPGLGQIYNRRYWKLPIVVGGFMGLVYATSWNGRMYADYQQAYLDVMDTDPNTNSYMDFFPPYYTEDSIDKTWLTNLLKTRKDSYRHYRDYCIVGMVALYLVCILDAYVDAELYHFDMSPDLAVDVKPALIPVTSSIQHTALGLQCAITF